MMTCVCIFIIVVGFCSENSISHGLLNQVYFNFPDLLAAVLDRGAKVVESLTMTIIRESAGNIQRKATTA